MILLVTLNARYSHASLGLRYLLANMGELEPQTKLLEYIINLRPQDVAEKLLAEKPSIIGFGVYIWNVEDTQQVVAILKQVAPEIVIVLGGPEVSHETDSQAIVELADHVITGPGDLAFPALCRQLLQGENPGKIIQAEPPPLAQIKLPYRHYTDVDIAKRTLYVEASRGCPFKCEFCLSSLDKTAWGFDLDSFLAEMQHLYDRGARQFKFVDRTFNLNVKTSLRILEFFLERLDEQTFLHFEVIPDHLPDPLKTALARFPAGSLQLEIGVQTFNPMVQSLISRKQDNAKTEANLRWLREQTNAHIHADLIVGLPGEDLASFASGFDRLIRINPQEIQVGVLKRLRGAPIARHEQNHGLRFNPHPPYTILGTDRLDFMTIQRLSRFARYWELVGNSGRFKQSRELILGSEPFARFLSFTDWVFTTTGQTYEIAQDRLFDLVFNWLTGAARESREIAYASLEADFLNSGMRGIPKFLQGKIAKIKPSIHQRDSAAARQHRHVVT